MLGFAYGLLIARVDVRARLGNFGAVKVFRRFPKRTWEFRTPLDLWEVKGSPTMSKPGTQGSTQNLVKNQEGGSLALAPWTKQETLRPNLILWCLPLTRTGYLEDPLPLEGTCPCHVGRPVLWDDSAEESDF